MKICIVIQSDSFRQSAGMRIRYDRVRECLADPTVTLDAITCEDLVASKTLEHDVYIFCKTFETRALVLARRIRSAGKVVGQDVFDDYFSQTTDPRLDRFRQWMRDMSPVTQFAICSTRQIAEVLRDYLPDIPITPIDDPIVGFDPLLVGALSDAKAARARETRELDIVWFGIGDNPYFTVGLADLAACEPELARMERLGWHVRLRIVTNRRAFESGGAEILRGVGVPFDLVEWTEAAERQALAGATLAILPVNGQRFSRGKSMNRALTALCGGCQVLNLGYPLYEQLGDFIYRSTDQLLSDLASGKCRLRRDRAPALTARLSTLANPYGVAAAFVAESRRAVAEASRVSSSLPRLCVIHGLESRRDLHKLVMSLGGISASTIFTDTGWNFRVRFDSSEGEMVMRVTTALAERFRLPVNRTKPAVRIRDFDFVEVDIDALKIRPLRIVAPGDMSLSELALYEDVMRFARDCCQAAFAPADILISEMSSTSPRPSLGRQKHSRAHDALLQRARIRLRTLVHRLVKEVRGFGRRPFAESGRRQRKRALALLERSSLFDRAWYLERNPDVAAASGNPLLHYLEFGWREKRDPGPGFSTKAYLRANPDVAAEGVNPLLHYLEHGRSEGREAKPASSATVRRSPENEFGPAAQCLSFPTESGLPILWKRSGQLDAARADAFSADGRPVGYLYKPPDRSAFDAAVARLSRLSGASVTTTYAKSDRGGQVGELVDAWHAGASIVRSRWRGNGDGRPFVVRALQQANGVLRLVGEALIECEFDVLDARLTNPFFPLLFVFAEINGEVMGWQHLSFPSMCRGGLHYLELVALEQSGGARSADALNICGICNRLADHLLQLIDQEQLPLVAEILVELDGADGTHPLFQSDFREWLSAVVRTPVRALGPPACRTAACLAEGVHLASDRTRARSGRRLLLMNDMTPSISALAATTKSVEHGEQAIAPSIALHGELSLAATLFRFPPGPAVALFSSSVVPFPRLESAEGACFASGDVPVLALRMPSRRPLSDAELLMPIAPADGELTDTPPISWLLWPKLWAEKELLQSLVSLAAQDIDSLNRLIFVESPAPAAVEALAARLFGGRVRTTATLEQATSLAATPLVGYLGPGVVLHDRRTAAVLATLLEAPENVSASAVIVSLKSSGKGSTVVVVEEGSESPYDSRLLWRTSWPTSRPSRDFWMTRTPMLARWLSHSGDAGGQHICTAVVTASYCSAQSDTATPWAPPPAENFAILTEALVG
jgi:hypothetical protein